MISIFVKILIFSCMIFGKGEAKDLLDSDIWSHLTREKCLGELGCFDAKSPFFDLVERPVSLLPDDRDVINVKFLLYTRNSPDVSSNFSNLDNSIEQLAKTYFNPYVATKFIIPGFISGTAPYWKQPLKEALLRFESSNLFFVDWEGGDGPIYEQAVANTRVVGAEIALFVQKLEKVAGVHPESVHLIGHSLGSNIAGYAGKRLQNLGRITAMDPAGPYFTHVDKVVRLDRGDALFVDAIHTNAAPNRFEGFGLTESIGHFDFYPNGGHLQPGCHDMGYNILKFLEHPFLDPEGLRGIQCNHIRAINLFISSLVDRECQLLGTQCATWQDYQTDKCGNCSQTGETCVPLGQKAIYFKNKIDETRSINFYLHTTEEEPYC